MPVIIIGCTNLTPKEREMKLNEYYKQRGLNQQDIATLSRLEDQQKTISSRKFNKETSRKEFENKNTLDTYKISLEMAKTLQKIDSGRYAKQLDNGIKRAEVEIEKMSPKKTTRNSSITEKVENCRKAKDLSDGYATAVGGLNGALNILSGGKVGGSYEWGENAAKKQTVPKAVAIYCN